MNADTGAEVVFAGAHHFLPHVIGMALLVEKSECVGFAELLPHIESELTQVSDGDFGYDSLAFLLF